MRRLVLAAFVLGGCTFEHGSLPDPPVADGPDPTVDAPAPSAVGCHATDPSLRLCLDFEDLILTPTAVDASGMHNDAQTQVLQAIPRDNQQAALVSSSSVVLVPEAAALDITPQLTIEMWVQAADLTTISSPLTNSGQYGLGISTGTPVCRAGGQRVYAAKKLVAGQWTHVACSYDGEILKVYVDGDGSGCIKAPAPSPIATTGTHGTKIGLGYTGGIDDVHVYASALPEQTLCQLAGQTKCSPACPTTE